VSDEQLLLAQEEIDALLSALNPEASPKPAAVPLTPVVAGPTAGEANGEVKVYDFRQPNRFSKEQMRALRLIHETWARRISVSLGAHLRTAVEVNLADIDQGVYQSMVQQIPDTGVFYIINPVPLPGRFMLYVTLDLAMVILDRMMGGPGTVSGPRRALTDLENSLLRSIMEKVLVDFQEAWANTAEIQPHIVDISSSLLLTPLALPTDSMLWMSFEVRIRGAACAMVLGLPYASLKPVANRLSPYNWIANSEQNPHESSHQLQRRVETTLGLTKTSVSVILGATVLSLQDMSSLTPGDVLPLNKRAGELCDILVHGRLKYRGRPGLQRHRLAVQVEEVVKEDWEGQESIKD
jgi:flagellar motor switch protein FliM